VRKEREKCERKIKRKGEKQGRGERGEIDR
jgi:hypothetical protein